MSRPFYSLSLVLLLGHPKRPIKSLFKINEVPCLIFEILLFVPDELLKTSRWQSHPLILHSYLIFEDLEFVYLSSEGFISNHKVSLAS
jgi:hypothetical protein